MEEKDEKKEISIPGNYRYGNTIDKATYFENDIKISETMTVNEGAAASEKAVTSDFGISIFVMCLFNFLPILFGILLLKAPQVIFRILDGTYVEIFCFPVLLFISAINFISIDRTDKNSNRLLAIQIVATILTITLIILGFCLVHTHTYELSSPKDFKLLNNLPTRITNENYYKFELTNDIDFEGYKPKDKYNKWFHSIVLEGNGYTIKNIKYSADLEHDVAFMYFGYNSKVSNLNIEDCEFEITPNAYDKKTHEGKGVIFSIIKAARLENVNIDATVYVKKPEENLRYNTYSSVISVYPLDNMGLNCKINIKVEREE